MPPSGPSGRTTLTPMSTRYVSWMYAWAAVVCLKSLSLAPRWSAPRESWHVAMSEGHCLTRGVVGCQLMLPPSSSSSSFFFFVPKYCCPQEQLLLWRFGVVSCFFIEFVVAASRAEQSKAAGSSPCRRGESANLVEDNRYDLWSRLLVVFPPGYNAG